jgi:hypothetical protein
LIYQTLQKIKNHSPRTVQTGPAARNDLKTLEKHRELLAGFCNNMPCWNEFETHLYEDIYDILTKSIQNGSNR